MNAHLFYATEADKAVLLYLVSKEQCNQLNDKLSAAERNTFAVTQFKGNMGQSCLIYDADGLLSKAYIGSGDGLQELALSHAALSLPPGTYSVQEEITQEAAIYWALAQYRFTAYKKYDLQPRVLLLNELEEIVPLVHALFLVRDLINKPASDMGPKELADIVGQMAQEFSAQFQQWVGPELLSENFPAIHAVGRAAESPPRLLSLTWGESHHPLITLVGKGVCFDTGGLDIKPSSGMRLMKKDMGGAAHVIGLAQYIMSQKMPVRLHVLIPAVENAIGPGAFRPGDVITMRNGLTVEIDNTDAEGRLILADALVKACEEHPELIIDFATLTGAARVAVGTEMAALLSNNDTVAAGLLEASHHKKDFVWRLPLFSGYEDLLNSSVADLANSSATPYAGAIVAGLFLQRFISPSIPWLHFDVMAWNIGSKPGKPEGGEAMGFRAVIEYLRCAYGKSDSSV